MRLDYVLFTANGMVVVDGPLNYRNLFDVIIDAMYSVLKKVSHPDVSMVASEIGWPSISGAIGVTVENAMTYNNNVVAHVTSSVEMPKRLWNAIETNIFAMFNEDLKPVGVERNFGLYHPNMTEVYHVNFP
ncbi:putative glucan endo-1,3-beta-glucosidase GVI [Elaeis guineensis]|uniref:putative glucan endo-1,3-beta-glucosidase GVI n=1 Tax=Elaeis guineensis var. tenera TaxID=51953 RepID=UPI003C6CC68E